MFYPWCIFFFFFRHAFSELPGQIALKLCHMIGIWLNCIIPLQKIQGGRRSPKKLGAKNMQNFGKFWTTSDIDREYLRNEATSKIGKTYELGKFLLRLMKEVPWTFIHQRLGITCEFGPTKIHFLGILSRPLGGAAPWKFTRARDWPRLASAHTNWDGGPQKN